MKATATTQEPEFKPVALTITLENQEEVNQMGDLIAIHHNITESFGVDLSPIWDVILQHMTNPSSSVVPQMKKLRDSLSRTL